MLRIKFANNINSCSTNVWRTLDICYKRSPLSFTNWNESARRSKRSLNVIHAYRMISACQRACQRASQISSQLAASPVVNETALIPSLAIHVRARIRVRGQELSKQNRQFRFTNRPYNIKSARVFSLVYCILWLWKNFFTIIIGYYIYLETKLWSCLEQIKNHLLLNLRINNNWTIMLMP